MARAVRQVTSGTPRYVFNTAPYAAGCAVVGLDMTIAHFGVNPRGDAASSTTPDGR
jgi:hypothetical protein